MRIPLISKMAESLSVAASDVELENWYLVPTPQGRSPFMLQGAPGTLSRGALATSSRGAENMNGVPYFVCGNSLYSWDSSHTITNHGVIAGSGRVDMKGDIDTLIIVTGAGKPGYLFTASTNTLTQITDPDFPGADTVDILDGYAFFTQGTGIWFISQYKAYGNFDPTETGAHESHPDNILNAKSNLGEIYVFGTDSTEVFYNSTNVDFPFDRNDSAIIDTGAIARWSVVQDDNTLYFLGDDRVVYRMRGYDPQRMSDESIEKILSEYTLAEVQAAWAYTYVDHGVTFYVLTIPGQVTISFDTINGLWHKRKFKTLNTHHGGAYVSAYGNHYIHDDANGDLLQMSRDYYDDNGTSMRSLSRSHYMHNEDNRMKWRKIKFIMEDGVGIKDDPATSPILMVRWSDDDGRIYKNTRFIDYGASGDYDSPVVTRNCGSSRNRIIEYFITDNAKRNMIDAYAEIT